MGIKDEVTLKGVEKYRECPECKGECATAKRIIACDTCNGTGEIKADIQFDEVEFYFLGEEDIDDKQTWWLKPHLSMWKVRSVKP